MSGDNLHFLFLKRVLNVLFILVLLCSVISSNAFAETNPPLKGKLVLEVKDKLINLKADDANFKDILKELEEKTGIKVVIYDGVADKNVSLNINSLPIYASNTILEKMALKNSAVVYDKQLGAMAIYVLPEGKDISDVIKGKSVITHANFTDLKDIDRVKGKEIVTITKGKNKVPIRYVKDEVLLRFHLGVSKKEIDEILKKHNLVEVKDDSITKIGYVKAKIPDGRDVLSVIKKIRKEYKIKIPEPNYVLNILAISDPLYNLQWYIPDTNFDSAWDKLKSNDTIKIAVIDSGVDSNHPDLVGRISKGVDLVNADTDASDDHGHGTFVSGIIAATANNIGIKGLNDNTEIIPVKVIDTNGFGTYEDVAGGIIYAADSGAKVINLSIGGYAYSFMLQEAVDYALEKGCIVVAAGGNDGIKQEIYPAAYLDVLGVSALGYDGEIWSYSNSGRHIDVCAPGANIISTGLGNNYVYASGTSASTPMVSALAAMLASEKPDLSSSFIQRLIVQAATDLGEKGFDQIYGAGEIDAQAAIKQKVKPFHDVAVKSVHIEPMAFEKEKPTYIVANIENTGTYKSENCDVTLYEIIGEEKKEIGKKQAIAVLDKKKVIFDWKPEKIEESIKFEVVVFSEKDENSSNNIKAIRQFYVRETDGLYVLYSVEPPVHQWIAYQAYKKLPSSELKTEMAYYIGPTSDTSPYLSGAWIPPSGWTANNDYAYLSSTATIEGAWEEDHPVTRCEDHFWDPDSTYDAGLFWWDSALEAGQDRFNNAINTYGTNKKSSYWWLGRAAHLLMDMSVPAHAMLDWHGTINGSMEGASTDSYEQFTAYSENYKKIRYNSSYTTVPNYTSLGDFPGYTPTNYDDFLTRLMYNLAEYGDDYDSDDYDGDSTNGDYNCWPAKNELDKDRGTVTKVEMTNFWGAVLQTLTTGTSYEIHRVIDSWNDEVFRIFYYQSFYEDINNTTNKVKVTYSNGTTESFFDLDEFGFLHEVIPSSLLERLHQKQLESRAIGYVAALYQLFWERTHPSVEPDQCNDLSISAYDWDDSVGDDDGVMEAGEKPTLKVRLRSVAGAQNVDVTLSTSDPYINITNSDVDFYSFAPGESQWSLGTFDMELNFNISSCDVTRTSGFKMYVTYELDGKQCYQNIYFSKTFYKDGCVTADFSVNGDVATDDDLSYRDRNDGDNVFESGEEVHIRPEICNVGTSNATDVDVELYYSGPGDPPIEIQSGDKRYADLSAGLCGHLENPSGYYHIYASDMSFTGPVDIGIRVDWNENTQPDPIEIPDAFQLYVHPAPVIYITPGDYYFGAVRTCEPVSVKTNVRNGGSSLLTVTGIQSSHADTSVNPSGPFTLEPGEGREIVVTIDTCGIEDGSDILRQITVDSDGKLADNTPPSNLFVITGLVSSDKQIHRIPGITGAQNPDISGDWIVYQDGRNGNYDIFAYQISTGTETQITTNTGPQSHPMGHGNLIVWNDWRNDDGSLSNCDIYGYDLSTQQEVVVSNQPGKETLIGVDGSLVAFVYPYYEFTETSNFPPPSDLFVYEYQGNGQFTEKYGTHFPITPDHDPKQSVRKDGDFGSGLLVFERHENYWQDNLSGGYWSSRDQHVEVIDFAKGETAPHWAKNTFSYSGYSAAEHKFVYLMDYEDPEGNEGEQVWLWNDGLPLRCLTKPGTEELDHGQEALAMCGDFVVYDKSGAINEKNLYFWDLAANQAEYPEFLLTDQLGYRAEYARMDGSNVVWRALNPDDSQWYIYYAFLGKRISVSPSSLDFGGVALGCSSERTIAITNNGNEDLQIGNITENNPLDAPFSILNDNCSGQIISPGEICLFTVRFSPLNDGHFNDSFDISSDDPENNPVIINVSGTGICEMGDIDSNGVIDLADAILALQVLAGFSPEGIHLSADVNGDKKIGIEEVIYILQKVSGLRE